MTASRFRIVELGPVAARTLARARRGRVVALFERSVYLDFDGELVCVGTAAIGSGPLNALVERRSLHALRASLALDDREVARRGTSSCVGTAVLDFASAHRWRPPSPAWPLERARLARGIARVRTLVKARCPHDGLAFLVAGAPSSSVLAPAARAASHALARWLVDGSARRLPALAALVGLGPGLTPSGDDFLGGALVALHAYGRVDEAHRLAAALLPTIERATHPVSVAHFRAACEGLGGEALHACLCDMAEAREPENSLARLAATGHTSGFDALAGAMTVAAASAGRADSRGMGERRALARAQHA